MVTIKIPVTLRAKLVRLACIVIIQIAYSLSSAQIKLNALEEIPMTLLVIQVCTSVRTPKSVFNA
jgi:hypothetical protein